MNLPATNTNKFKLIPGKLYLVIKDVGRPDTEDPWFHAKSGQFVMFLGFDGNTNGCFLTPNSRIKKFGSTSMFGVNYDEWITPVPEEKQDPQS